MKRVSSSWSVRVLGMALGVTLIATSTSNAFWFRLPIFLPLPDFAVPGFIGNTNSHPLLLPNIGAQGQVNQNNPNPTNFHKIFINALLNDVVANGSGFTNNRTRNPHEAVSHTNNQTVNTFCNQAINPYSNAVIGRNVNITHSQLDVEEDATPQNTQAARTDEQAFATISCSGTL